MTRIRSYTATLVLAGTAAGTVQYGMVAGLETTGTPINGQLLGIQLQFTPTMTGGTAVVATIGQGGPVQTMLNYVGGTSQWFYPRPQSQSIAGAGLGAYDRFPIDDTVSLVVSGGAAGTVVSRMLVYQ